MVFQFTKLVLLIGFILNVIGWGGMIFLLLIGAADRTIPDEHTRKVWIEIDAQVLNGLFCIPGFGLIPWRLRDLYQLHSREHRPKLRQRRSTSANIVWIGLIVWASIFNSLFQIGVAVCLWAFTMDNRPNWLVGVLVGLACLTGIVAGLTQLILQQRAKKKKLCQEKSPQVRDPLWTLLSQAV